MLLCTQWRQPPKKCAKGKHTHPSPVIAGGQQPNVQGVDRKEERLRVEAEVPRHPAMRRLAMPRMSLWQHQLPTPTPPPPRQLTVVRLHVDYYWCISIQTQDGNSREPTHLPTPSAWRSRSQQ